MALKKYLLVILSCVSLMAFAQREAFVVTTTDYGQLQNVIGDNAYEIDSLVVNGPIDATDFAAIWDCAFYGKLQAVNLANADVKDNIIPDFAFYNAEAQMIDPLNFYTVGLREIILPEGITEIGDGAFRCTEIETIHFPASLKKLGVNCFYLCVYLDPQPLIIPEGIEEIPDHCFRGCYSLTEVKLPETLKGIGWSAFQGTFNMYCNFPESLEYIDGFAFYDVQGLTSVILPPNCLTLGQSAFDGCMNIDEFHLPFGVTTIPDFFLNTCTKLKELEIPETVTHIGDNAFSQSGIKSFVIPEGVEYIGQQAFAHCEADSIVLPSTLTYLGGQSCRFYKVDKIFSKSTTPAVCGTFINEGPFKPNAAPLYVPKGTAELYRNAYGWDVLTNIIEIDYNQSSVVDVVNNSNLPQPAIYNLQGVRLTSEPESGIYIKNGKITYKR